MESLKIVIYISVEMLTNVHVSFIVRSFLTSLSGGSNLQVSGIAQV